MGFCLVSSRKSVHATSTHVIVRRGIFPNDDDTCSHEKPMIKIYSPSDELELAMIRGVLDTEGIHYFVHNDYFGSMRVGPQIDLLNRKAIMVAPTDAERVREIIASLLEATPTEEAEPEEYSRGQKLRMILETLFFGWFIPGRRRRRRSSDT